MARTAQILGLLGYQVYASLIILEFLEQVLLPLPVLTLLGIWRAQQSCSALHNSSWAVGGADHDRVVFWLTYWKYSNKHINFMICLCFWQIFNSVLCSFLESVFKGKIPPKVMLELLPQPQP